MEDRDMWRRRHAVQIAAQLPDDPQDAIAVLDHAKSLVEKFLAPRAPQDGSVVVFRAADALSRR